MRRGLQKDRLHLLDEIRGFAVIAMILHHGLFLFSSFGLDLRLLHLDLQDIFLSVWFEWLRFPFVLTFLLLSGMACSLARSNLKRGAFLYLVATAVSLVTGLMGMSIRFGILHLLAVCMLLAGLLERVKFRPPLWVILPLGFLTLLLYSLPMHKLGMPGLTFYTLPDSLYATDFLFWLGLPGQYFHSADYFPLIPWVFPFLIGVIFGQRAKEMGWPEWFYPKKVPFLAFIGRHSLLFYLGHQPIFYCIFFMLYQAL